MFLKTNKSTLKWPNGQRAEQETTEAFLSLGFRRAYQPLCITAKGMGYGGWRRRVGRPAVAGSSVHRIKQGGQHMPLTPSSSPHPATFCLFGPNARSRHRSLAHRHLRPRPGWNRQMEGEGPGLNHSGWAPSFPSPVSLWVSQECWDTECRPHPKKRQDAGNTCWRKTLRGAQGCLNKSWRWAEVAWKKDSAQKHV